jgi:hypothetical protein
MTWTKPKTTGTLPPVSTFPAAFAFGRHIWILGGGRLEATYVSDNVSVLDTGTQEILIFINFFSSYDDLGNNQNEWRVLGQRLRFCLRSWK